jgi:hypothetical protein
MLYEEEKSWRCREQNPGRPTRSFTDSLYWDQYVNKYKLGIFIRNFVCCVGSNICFTGPWIRKRVTRSKYLSCNTYSDVARSRLHQFTSGISIATRR